MGEPLRIDPASHARWAPLETKRVLLLCAAADLSIVELTRPQLELQRLRFDVVTDAFDSDAVWNALAADTCPTVVAVVVSRVRARAVARPIIDAFSEVAGPLHRLFVLDLRRRPSVLQQVRALTEAARGLELTMEIDRESRAALTASATENARASGELRLSPCGVGTRRLRVVQPSVLLSPAAHEGSQTIPARTRFRLTASPMPGTCPDLPAID